MSIQDDDTRFHGALRDAAAEAGRLPQPTAEERDHSDALTAHIRDRMEQAGGAISFAEFMDLALYAPGLGYYSAPTRKFGAAGDFITAPEISPLFSRCVARQCAQVLEGIGGGDIIEAGAGSGALAAACLRELEQLDRLPNRYYILELSAELRERQAARLADEVPTLSPRVHWLDALPETDFRGVVVANELLDAMPVERFRTDEHGVQQLYVGWGTEGFGWLAQPAEARLRERVESLGLASNYMSEVNFNAEAWVATLAERIKQGVMLLIDYGFPRTEYYHPQRDQGTLMCHYRHRAHDNPLILVGIQDITAHIDFTAIAEAAHDAGLGVLGYTSQAAFLLGNGLDRMAMESDASDMRAHLSMTTQIKKLTMPSEMGELFKAIAFGKDVDFPLDGFAIQDRRGRL